MILSDVHLSTLSSSGPVHRGPDAAALVDRCLANAVDQTSWRAFAERVPLEIVLAGDIFDLDAPSLDASEPELRARRAEDGAAIMMTRILAAHPTVVAALQRAIGRGQRVAILPGNHDSQLNLSSVRTLLAQALSSADWLTGGHADGRIAFRCWFHVTPDGILVEHGHQYDPICRMRSVLPHVGPDGRLHLEQTVGTVATHHVASIFPDVDPFAVDPMKVLPAAPASMMLDQLKRPESAAAVAACARELLTVGDPVAIDSVIDPMIAEAAAETRLRIPILARHYDLAAPKSDAAFLAHAASGGYDYGRDVDRRLRTAMRASADLYSVRAVVSGHTHDPFLERDRAGRVFANAGHWSPSTRGPIGTFVLVDTRDAAVHGHLCRVAADGSIG